MSDIAVEEHFSTGKVHIDITGRETEGRLALEFRITSRNDCVMHWGLSRRRDPLWHAPPESTWPPATVPFDRHAVQSACQTAGGQGCVIRINLDLPCLWDSLVFVLYSPREDRWLHDGARDFRVRLPRRTGLASPQEALAKAMGPGDWRGQHFDLGEGESLAAGVNEQARGTRVLLACDADAPLVLHWAWPANSATSGSSPGGSIGRRTAPNSIRRLFTPPSPSVTDCAGWRWTSRLRRRHRGRGRSTSCSISPRPAAGSRPGGGTCACPWRRNRRQITP